MRQSRVEIEDYTVSMKIAFSASIYAVGHCLRSFRSLAPLLMCETSYGPQNTAHFGIAAYCISKNRQKRSRQGAVCVLGGIFVDCVLVERRVKVKRP